MRSKKIKIIPLGGLGEVGMNCLVLESERDLVLVDCGLQFPDASWSGVELLMPDLRYVYKNIQKLRGVVVTHGHDDHIGAIPFLAKHAKLNVYSTPFPAGLLRQKIQEVEGVHPITFHEIYPGKAFTVGPFKFEGIAVKHSIIEALGFAIETPAGTIVHSGDFKHDAEDGDGPTGFGRFEEVGRGGVELLFSDSTNAERPGHTLSEKTIVESFNAIFEAQTGRIIVALFASNIRRVERLLQAAARLGKKVAFAGRSMHSYTKLANEQSALNIPMDTLVPFESIHKFRDDKIVILATGSQAEPRSALVRIAEGLNKDFQVKPGDQVILSSRFIPGNERAITKMIDALYRAGAEVMYESIHQIHVSGHGCQEELLMMLNATRPKHFVPIHGEYRHLAKHAKLARKAGVESRNIFVIEDGQSFELSSEGVELGPKYELQKTPIVETEFLEATPELLTQRNNLSKTGVVFVIFTRQKKHKKLLTRPAVFTYGILYREGQLDDDVISRARELALKVYGAAHKKRDFGDVLRLEMRRFFKKRASHKPTVLSVIQEI